VLVVEYRHRPAVLLEDVGHLLEELVARTELLAELVGRIVAVLADDKDGIDRDRTGGRSAFSHRD